MDQQYMAHILVPTDFSENALHACRYAVQLFGTENNVYTLLHTYMDAEPYTGTWPGLADEMYKSSMIAMGEWRDKLCGMPAFAGAVINTEVAYGNLSVTLNDLVEEKHVDITVMGTQGRAGSALLGSNAAEVVMHSRRPVIVVPEGASMEPVRKILFADDQKRVEVAGLRMLIQLALRCKAEIILAHVLNNTDELPDPQVVEMYEELLQAVPHRFVSTEGKDLAGAIDLLGEREHADMIAVLHRHKNFLENLFHASTAKRLALHTKVPLLVMPELDAKPSD